MSRVSGRIKLIPIAAAAIFSVSIVALHLLRTDLDPASFALSYYGIGQYGFLLTIGNIALGSGILAGAFALRPGGQARLLRIGIALFYLLGILVIVTGIFPIDPPNTDPSASGIIHVAAGNLAFLCMAPAVLLLTIGLRQQSRSLSSFSPIFLLAIAVLIVSLLLIVSPPEIGGLMQRALYLPFLGWLVVAFKEA